MHRPSSLSTAPAAPLAGSTTAAAPDRALSSAAEEHPAADTDHPGPPDLGTGADDEHSDPTPGESLAPPPTLEHGGVPIASRYAGLDRSRCEAELAARHIPHERVGEARGVLAPLRLTGPLEGVTFRSALPAAQRKFATMEIYDCRLVLALDDFARLLARHDIVEVIHLSVYRPATTKSLKARPSGLGRRHGGALAIDAAIFKTKSGDTMSVEKDFHGRIGARPCPAPADATELRKIACEANDERLFNVLLTPDYNWAHRNHFHLEVTAGVKWTLVR
jgi:hypothetical protein